MKCFACFIALVLVHITIQPSEVLAGCLKNQLHNINATECYCNANPGMFNDGCVIDKNLTVAYYTCTSAGKGEEGGCQCKTGSAITATYYRCDTNYWAESIAECIAALAFTPVACLTLNPACIEVLIADGACVGAGMASTCNFIESCDREVLSTSPWPTNEVAGGESCTGS